MEENAHKDEMIIALLEYAPEEVAFQWVFNRSVTTVDFYLKDFVWPHDKDRTLGALNHEKRPVTDLRDFYIPMLAGRPDILLEIIKSTSRKTVVKSIIDHAHVKYISPAQYQELRLAALEKLGADSNNAISDRLGEWFFHYGDEAAEAFVQAPRTVLKQDATGNHHQIVQVDCPVGYVSSATHYQRMYWSGIMHRTGTLTGLLEHTKAADSQDISQIIFHYLSSNGAFRLEELRDYLNANQVELKFSSLEALRTWLKVLPREFFKGIKGVQRVWEALSPFVYVKAPADEVAKVFALCSYRSDETENSASSDDHLGSYEEYAALQSPAFYSFTPVGVTEPLGVLTREQYLALVPDGYWSNAAKHVVSLFSLDWGATLAHTKRFPMLALHHVSFDPYAKMVELLNSKTASGTEYQAASFAISCAPTESLEEAPESARELLKTVARHPQILANRSNRLILVGLGKLFTASEIREALIEAAADKILDDQKEYTVVRFIDDLDCLDSIRTLTKDSEKVVTVCFPTQFCRAVSKAYKLVIGTGSKSEQNLLKILKYLGAPGNSLNSREDDCLRVIMEDILDYSNPVGSISRLLEAAGLAGTLRGKGIMVSMVKFGRTFHHEAQPGFQLLVSNKDFQNFVLKAYRDGITGALPAALGRVEADLVISGDIPLGCTNGTILWAPKVLSFIKDKFQGAPSGVWETFISLSEHWEGTLSDLIDTSVVSS